MLLKGETVNTPFSLILDSCQMIEMLAKLVI